MSLFHKIKTNHRRSSGRIICYLLTITISLVYPSCKPSDDAISDSRRISREIYVYQFKLTYFQSLLIKSYNNSNGIQEIIQSDRSGHGEPVLTGGDLRLIDSLTAVDNDRLVADSASSIGAVAEGSGG